MSERRVLVGAADGVDVAIVDGLISEVAPGLDTDGARVTQLDGATVLPAFVDAHVHTVRTGFAITGLDLTGTPSLSAVLDALATHAAAHPGAAVLVGQGWDETDWPEHRPPTGAELDRAAPGRATYLTRVDGHSSVISSALAARVEVLEQLDGWSPDGRVERDAHHQVRAVLETLISDDDRLDAARAACRAMAARGIAHFHENAAPHIGPESEVALVRRAAAEVGLRVTVYWGRLLAGDTARRLGAAGLAGDLIADGALGSRTAALTSPYGDAPSTCGHGYVTSEQVRDHVLYCDRAGLQAGFHVIGDAAIDTVLAGFELADAVTPVRPGHRLEHVEMPSPRAIATMARLRITASVQPMFDALWGGPDGMYADRLGERWADTNPFAALVAAGVPLAFGSDSPVTPLGPWAAIRAATDHHHPAHRIPFEVALAAHTGGARVAVGEPADLAAWHHLDDPQPTLAHLLVAGHPIDTATGGTP